MASLPYDGVDELLFDLYKKEVVISFILFFGGLLYPCYIISICLSGFETLEK